MMLCGNCAYTVSVLYIGMLITMEHAMSSSILRLEDAIQQWHRASRLETLARTEAGGAPTDLVTQKQLSVLKRTTASARAAVHCAREANDAGVAAGVVHQAAVAARGCADAAEDALEVLRALLLALNPAFRPTAPPPPRSSTTPDSPGPLTREASLPRLHVADSAEVQILAELPGPDQSSGKQP
jgi:hypothetical protein